MERNIILIFCCDKHVQSVSYDDDPMEIARCTPLQKLSDIWSGRVVSALEHTRAVDSY